MLGHATHVWSAALITAVLYRHRTGVSGLMVGVREMKDRDGSNERTLSLDLPYSPFKVALVAIIQSEISGELYTVVTGSDCRLHCEL